MDFTLKVRTSTGKNTTSRSHSITIKDVAVIEQVHVALDQEFKAFFPPQAKLTETKSKK